MKQSYIQHVNICQGTKSTYRFSNGNTLPLVQRPFGMISFAPQTNGLDDWWFNPDIPIVEGIRLTHQPSPWIKDDGMILITPQSDVIVNCYDKAYSSYRKCDSVLRPDYLKIKFLRSMSTFELTPSERCASIKVNFEKDFKRCISIFNIKKNSSFEYKNGMIFGTTDAESGMGVANNFKMYFVIKQKNRWIDQNETKVIYKDKKVSGIHIGVLKDVKECLFDIAISYISFEQAIKNLEEINDSTFDEIKDKSEKVWEQYLSKICIDADEKTMKTFYSCLYRTGLFPHKAYEINEDNKEIHYSPYKGCSMEGVRYTDTGFWYTYRTQFPLFSLIAPDVYKDVLKGALCDYNECGFLPRWPSIGEVGCMPSTLIDSVIAHAAVCNIIDDELTLKPLDAMKYHANNKSEDERFGRCGIEYYLKLGYVPYDKYKESVNLTLDFAYSDYCIARVLEKVSDTDLMNEYLKRSKNYENIFDKKTKFMRAKDEKGEWRDNFDPNLWGLDYTEASAWQTTLSVPHDLEGLALLFGGVENLLKRLDEIFEAKPYFRVGGYGGEIHEMTEMVMADLGLCAISNQPSFLIPYIYAYFGETEKTESIVNYILNTVFSFEDDGFPGDEDNGSMASWYILSQLGMYPVSPADNLWIKIKSNLKASINGVDIEKFKENL